MKCPGLHCNGCGSGSGLLAGGVVLVGLVGAGVALYHGLEGALGGVAASTATANVVVACLVGGAVALVALVIVGWWLVGRWRDRHDGLTDGTTPDQAAAFTLEVDAALERRRLELDAAERVRLDAADHRARLEGPRQPAATRRQRPRKVASTRADRPVEDGLDAPRAPVDLNDLDAGRWSA